MHVKAPPELWLGLERAGSRLRHACYPRLRALAPGWAAAPPFSTKVILLYYMLIRPRTWLGGRAASASAALSPSEEQSEMGHPWSLLLKGHAPLEMCR